MINVPFNLKEASKVMHLAHFTNNEEREDDLSHCHICLKKCDLTREHIPPKKAFNGCDKVWERLVCNKDEVTSVASLK